MSLTPCNRGYAHMLALTEVMEREPDRERWVTPNTLFIQHVLSCAQCSIYLETENPGVTAVMVAWLGLHTEGR